MSHPRYESREDYYADRPHQAAGWSSTTHGGRAVLGSDEGTLIVDGVEHLVTIAGPSSIIGLDGWRKPDYVASQGDVVLMNQDSKAIIVVADDVPLGPALAGVHAIIPDANVAVTADIDDLAEAIARRL